MSTDVSVSTAQSGFYKGFNKIVAITPKFLVLCLIAWAVLQPEHAQKVLLSIQHWTTSTFGSWYMVAAAIFMITVMVLAIIPKTGRIKLGQENDRPEFSLFSWFSI